MRKLSKSAKYLILSIVLVVISMIGASAVQTSLGETDVRDLRWETPSGNEMSALLFIPEDATEENPAPAIVTSHGWYNNREMQDLNFVELSRRGYVVMSIDMYGHGNSEAIPPEDWEIRGTGMYDGVELIADLPYVDTENIGVTGHSNGARAANWSVQEDNNKPEDERLISSVLLIANDAMYTDNPEEPLYYALRPEEENFANVYGSRDVGIIAAQYDEFFFRSVQEDGTITPPRDYIYTDYAQSFLNFGIDPNNEDAEQREPGTMYTEEIDNSPAIRAIYTPNQIHPWNHFSATVVGDTVDFFEASIPAPNPIDSSSQTWQIKVLFNFIGLIGFFMFLVSFTKVMLNAPAFASLKTKERVEPDPAPTGNNRLVFWVGLVLTPIIAAVSYVGLYNWSMEIRPDFFPQPQVFYVGVWSLFMAIVTLLILLISQAISNKSEKINLREKGVIIDGKSLLKTIVLSIIVVAAAFLLVFIADYFFKTDFRIWILAVKAFDSDKLVIGLKYLPMFIAFFVLNSISVNAFNYVSNHEKEWVNTAILVVFNGLGMLAIILIQYIHFFIDGEIFFTNQSPLMGIWLFAIVILVPLATIITRKIYRETKNPYLGGIIYGLVITLIMVSNTLTQI